MEKITFKVYSYDGKGHFAAGWLTASTEFGQMAINANMTLDQMRDLARQLDALVSQIENASSTKRSAALALRIDDQGAA